LFSSDLFRILLPHEPSESDGAALSARVAAMCDIGLEPGCSVRTIDQCVTEARGDITVETSLLETRWLAGSRKLTQPLHTRMMEHLDARVFFQGKRAEMQQRHARYQDTPFSLEPNCTESPGGLRDLHIHYVDGWGSGIRKTLSAYCKGWTAHHRRTRVT